MNWRLLFSGAESTGWLIYAGTAVLLALGISVWLLQLERRMVSRTVGWTLLLLRGLVLALLLVTMLQPLLTKQFDIAERGRVLVAIDASVSMETRDRHAAMGEKLRWAQALGMLGNAGTATLLDRWVAEAESGREPNWLGTDAQPQNPVEQAAYQARRGQIQEALDELAEMPRTEFVRRLLTASPQKLLTQIENVMPVDLRLFATEQQAISPQELEARLLSDRGELNPAGTDAVQTIRTILSEENAQQIQAFVLVTDGRQTIPADAATEAQRLAALHVPVFTIPIGSRLAPRDLSVAAIDAPETVFLNDKAILRVVLGTSGFEGQQLTVELQRDGDVLQQQTVTPTGDSAALSFSVPSDKSGRFDYRIVSRVQEGELRDDNNSREVSLQVVDNKARVMLVDGDARWEFRYLKNLLERDRQVQSTSVLFRQPFLEILNQPAITPALPPLEAFREQLTQTDVLILGDVEPNEVDEAVWKVLDDAVTRDGLTLVIIPGKKGMPQAFQSQTLATMLPVTDFRQKLAEQFLTTPADAEQTTFRLALSADAQTMPMFQLSENPANRDTSLSSLPGHPWVYGGVAKPGASVWATASIPGVATEPEPVIVHQDYGFGQVVWMGIDSTWRWRRRAGDEWHYRFWGQLIRWGARNKAAAGNSDVRLSISDVIIEEDETPEATLKWDRRLIPQLAGATVEILAEPLGPDGKVLEATTAETPEATQPGNAQQSSRQATVMKTILQPAADAPERFTGRLPRLTAGAWRIRASASDSQISIADSVQTEVFVRRQVSAELADVSCNRELLQQLAQLSGGEMIEPWDAARLTTLLQPKDQPEQQVQERTLWDHWMIIVLFFGLLMSEWVLRRLHGLP